jgi:uncharacterized protein (TIGR00251 family)
MEGPSYLRNRGSECSITVVVSPGAKVTEIEGVDSWRRALRVRVAAERREGAANDELLRYVSERLSIPKSSVRILRGEKSSVKVVGIALPGEKVSLILRGE